ncbi:MAG: ABC transporter permease [Fusobacteriaceae bacterium]
MQDTLILNKSSEERKIYSKLSETQKAGLFVLPFAVIMIMFLIAPFIAVFLGSFLNSYNQFSFENYMDVFQSKFIKQAITNSLELSIISTIFGLVIALQGAYSLNKIKGSSKKTVILLINMISNFSGIPLAFAFVILLGANGFLTILLKNAGVIGSFDVYSRTGLLLMYTYFQIPLGILLLYPVFDRFDPQWREMVEILGGNSYIYWIRIGIPMILRDVLGTMMIMFANAMGAYACTLALTNGTYNVMTIRIASYIAGETSYEPGLASAMSIILGGMLVFTILVKEFMLKNKRGK